ncbi:MAG: T9SS type A sorting domain-containing protein [Bacteroidales bacterium]|nr:T9SS type A sorting domain-containing protein [Bacteroidales bacterium]MCF8391711.1 T9SS type A sorting domain-containing protein [Bacteroidales bacterium]
MKTTFTQKNTFIKTSLLAVAMISSAQFALSQTTHQVAVTSNSYTPSTITINVGDKVVWTNTQGNHNVNATQATFPANPESFGNSVSSGWTFEHTFLTAGTYNYQCDPHINFGMTGIVEVVEISTGNSFTEIPESGKVFVYPNPVNSDLNISFRDQDFKSNSVNVYSISGALLMNKSFNKDSQSFINLSQLDSGFYIIEVLGDTTRDRIKILKQ